MNGEPCSDLVGPSMGPCADCGHARIAHRLDTRVCSICLLTTEGRRSFTDAELRARDERIIRAAMERSGALVLGPIPGDVIDAIIATAEAPGCQDGGEEVS